MQNLYIIFFHGRNPEDLSTMYHKNNKTDKVYQSYARYILASKSYLKYEEFIFIFFRDTIPRI